MGVGAKGTCFSSRPAEAGRYSEKGESGEAGQAMTRPHRVGQDERKGWLPRLSSRSHHAAPALYKIHGEY